ncbi:hypothetical protein CANINC_004282 [Pichia inconspicua]|uniref:Protein YAE1 n=1 Tax=Pichia inconspicua TaxID=52247 RepID=A0A4T0WWC5_9ASCO|nr:hypothetical protein CANINC_004282 [[Candida] inconspicua]
MASTSCDKSDCICGKQNTESVKVESLSNVSDDDLWASSDNEQNDKLNFNNPDDDNQHLQNSNENQDITAIKRRHENRGYYDGLTKGKDSGLQKGFDLGYPVGAQLGGLVGELIAETIWKFDSKQIDQDKRDEILNDLRIDKILSSDYFDSNLDIENPSSHPLIQKWTTFFKK